MEKYHIFVCQSLNVTIKCTQYSALKSLKNKHRLSYNILKLLHVLCVALLISIGNLYSCNIISLFYAVPNTNLSYKNILTILTLALNNNSVCFPKSLTHYTILITMAIDQDKA